MTRSMPAPALDWLFASEWLGAMADESGSNPKSEKAPLSFSPSRDTQNEANPRPKTLLLAEDNLPDALLVREAIQKEGLPVDVHIAADGKEAVDFIMAAETDPDAPSPHILVLDLNLPKMDGFEVLRRVRASGKHRHIPVLIVTSSDSPADKAEAARLGAAYFRKPTSYEEYLLIGGVLAKLLQERR